MTPILLSSFAIMLVSLTSVVFIWKKANDLISRHLKYFVSFSAGVFLIIAYQIFLELHEHYGKISSSIFWIIVGAIGISLVFRFLPTFHHHHDENEETHSHSKLDIRRIITADAIHNIADGILLTSSYAINPVLGIVATASILFHEIIQETSEFFVMKQAGFSTKKALLINFMASSTVLIGSIGSYFLLDKFEYLEAPLLGISAGIFLLVVFFDLIPHSVRHSKKSIHYFAHMFWFLLGIFIMSAIIFVSPHLH